MAYTSFLRLNGIYLHELWPRNPPGANSHFNFICSFIFQHILNHTHLRTVKVIINVGG